MDLVSEAYSTRKKNLFSRDGKRGNCEYAAILSSFTAKPVHARVYYRWFIVSDKGYFSSSFDVRNLMWVVTLVKTAAKFLCRWQFL